MTKINWEPDYLITLFIGTENGIKNYRAFALLAFIKSNLFVINFKAKSKRRIIYGKCITRIQIAGLKTFFKPTGTLGGSAVIKGIGHRIPLRLHL